MLDVFEKIGSEKLAFRYRSWLSFNKRPYEIVEVAQAAPNLDTRDARFGYMVICLRIEGWSGDRWIAGEIGWRSRDEVLSYTDRDAAMSAARKMRLQRIDLEIKRDTKLAKQKQYREAKKARKKSASYDEKVLDTRFGVVY
jgi:hypothetical protein